MPSGNTASEGERADTNKSTIHRRAVLGSIGATGSILVAGCGGDSGGGDGGGGDGSGGDGSGGGGDGSGGDGSGGGEQPTYLVADLNGNPTSLDPATVEPTANNAKMVWPDNAYETLLFYEEDGPAIEPRLATEIPTVDNGLITNDGMTFEFPLREGVMFHTGDEMTAEDVRFTIERATTMNLAPDAGEIDQAIEEIEVVDDYTIRITTDQPRPAFLTGTIPSKTLGIISQEAVESNGGVSEGQRNQWVAQNTAGTGPYYLAQWNSGSNLRWEPHEDYWDPDTVGPDGVFQRIHSDVSSSVASISAGEIHFSGREAGSLAEFEDSGADFTFFQSLEQLFFFFNYEIPYDRDNMPDDDTVPSDFFQDPNVRKAFAYTIPYEDYIETVWDGAGYNSNQPCHTNALIHYDDSAPNFEHDPERAEELFREAGYWDEGFTFTLMSENFAEAAATQLYIKDQLEALNDNFSINTMTMPESQYVNRRSEDPWAFTCDAGGFPSFGPDPAPYYQALYNGPPGTGTRMAEHIPQEQIDLADEAGSTLDDDRRGEIYAELQRLTVEDPPHISLLTEQLVKIHLPCADPHVNPAVGKDIARYWDISGCERIEF